MLRQTAARIHALEGELQQLDPRQPSAVLNINQELSVLRDRLIDIHNQSSPQRALASGRSAPGTPATPTPASAFTPLSADDRTELEQLRATKWQWEQVRRDHKLCGSSALSPQIHLSHCGLWCLQDRKKMEVQLADMQREMKQRKKNDWEQYMAATVQASGVKTADTKVHNPHCTYSARFGSAAARVYARQHFTNTLCQCVTHNVFVSFPSAPRNPSSCNQQQQQQQQQPFAEFNCPWLQAVRPQSLTAKIVDSTFHEAQDAVDAGSQLLPKTLMMMTELFAVLDVDESGALEMDEIEAVLMSYSPHFVASLSMPLTGCSA